MKNWTSQKTQVAIGYGDTGHGAPMLLLHAFPQTREMWAMQVEEFAGRCRMITPDLPGFGASPAVPSWTVDGIADLLVEFLAGIGINEPVIVGGLSMGGYIALALARRHPEKIRALILADTKAEGDTPEGKAGREKSIKLVREVGVAALVETMVPKILGITSMQERPAVVAEVSRVGAEQSVNGVVAALEALRDRPDGTPALSQIRVPTLVIVGEEDTLTPPEASMKLADAISNSKRVLLPQSGHLSSVETPALFNQAVSDFLHGILSHHGG